MRKPRETRTLEQGCGFLRVGVRVARRIPYGVSGCRAEIQSSIFISLSESVLCPLRQHPRGTQRGFPKHDVVSMGVNISARGPLIEFLYGDYPIRLSVKHHASENTSFKFIAIGDEC